MEKESAGLFVLKKKRKQINLHTNPKMETLRDSVHGKMYVQCSCKMLQIRLRKKRLTAAVNNDKKKKKKQVKRTEQKLTHFGFIVGAYGF